MDVIAMESRDVGVATEKPDQLGDDRAQVELLGGQQGEALVEVKAHLVPKDATDPHACAVGLIVSIIEDFLEQVEVGFHRGSLRLFVQVMFYLTDSGGDAKAFGGCS